MHLVSKIWVSAFLVLFIPSLVFAQRLTLSGIYGVAQGGTGAATFTAGVMISPGGTTALTSIANVATGRVLVSGTPAAWSATPRVTQLNIGASVGASPLYIKQTSDAADGAINIESIPGGTTRMFNEGNGGLHIENQSNANGFVLFNRNSGLGTNVFATSAVGVLAMLSGTPGTTYPVDQAELSVKDWNGAGTATFEMHCEEGTACTHTFGSTVVFGGALRIATTFTSTATGALGWVIQNAANQACNTTCTTGACVVGLDTGAVGNFLACTDATADTCLCAG